MYNLKSKTDSVGTPNNIMRALRKEFGRLYDPTPFNPKFSKSKNKDALTSEWGKTTYVNPPFSDSEHFLMKAHEEWRKGKTIIFLAKTTITSSKYFEKFGKGAEIRFISHKVKFKNYKDEAWFPLMFLIFRAGKRSSKWRTVSFEHKQT